MLFEDLEKGETFRAPTPTNPGEVHSWVCSGAHRADRLDYPRRVYGTTDWEITKVDILFHFDHGPSDHLGTRLTSCGERVTAGARHSGEKILVWKKSEVTCPQCRKAMRGHKPPEGFSFAEVQAFVVIQSWLSRGGGFMTAKRFAQLMWPRSDAHFKTSNVGHGATSGVGAWRAGGSVLNRLHTKFPRLLYAEGRYRNQFKLYPGAVKVLQSKGVL